MSDGPLLPVDCLPEVWPDFGKRVRVGALLHAASTTSCLEPTLKALERLDEIELCALFGPQHGFEATTQDNMVEWRGFSHPRLGIPVHSLYGDHREPTPEMLDGLDVLLVDLVDVGARYYTFIWTLYLCMAACERAGVHVIVCDRPNPLNGVSVEGDPQDPDYLSFVGLHPLPIRHGLTIGELARRFQQEVFPNCALEVLPLTSWDRAAWHDETGLPWVMPSPNMPTLETATVYPGMCLLEGTNLSEGRGTTRPFELFGAPWLDRRALIARLRSLELPGVHFREVSFEPTFQKHTGRVCQGAQLHILSRDEFLPVRTGFEIIRAVRDLHPEQFSWNQPPYEYEYEKLPIEILAGGPVARFFD